MIARFLSLVAIVAAVAASKVGKLFREDPAAQKYMWESFKTEWSKRYESVDAEVGRTYPFIYSFIYSFIHSFIHLFIHPAFSDDPLQELHRAP